MAFTLPQFNCLCNTYRQTAGGPISYLPQLTNQQCQLYVNPRLDMTSQDAFYDPGAYVRFPIHTDVIATDWIELEPGDDYWYEVVHIERMHKNFPNEYLTAKVIQLSAGSSPPGELAAENGDVLETEGGDGIDTE